MEKELKNKSEDLSALQKAYEAKSTAVNSLSLSKAKQDLLEKNESLNL